MTILPHKRTLQSGTVALEFGLLASIFIGMLIGVFELGYLLFAQVSLDYATTSAARELFTGRVSVSSGTSQASFQAADFCSFLNPLITCSGVLIVLQPVTNYQSALSGQTAPTSGTTVNPGGPGSMMMLEAFYTPGIAIWPLNVATLTSTAAFVNEY
jgi:Flp pilus assembly protein TadG